MKIKEFKVSRRLSFENLKSLCVRNDYYTKGTFEEYTRLLDMLTNKDGAPVDMTDDLIIAVAEDIYNHSNIIYLCARYNCDRAEILQNILHEVYDACYTLILSEIEED